MAYLTGSLDFDAGVVISASHNPYQDNGIKVFSGAGVKYGGQFENRIEALVADSAWQLPVGDAPEVPHADHLRKYLEHARSVLPNLEKLHRVRLAVDCANGAMTTVAPALFKELGFDVTVLGAEPDGQNINRGVGSTHPEKLAAVVKRGGYRLGVAFDGDGDRAILVDGQGRVLDGDHVMLMCARQMKTEGRLRGNAVVATVMSNIGLEIALKKLGIELIRTKVGDKYVMEEMQKRDLSSGRRTVRPPDFFRASVHGRRPYHRPQRASDHGRERKELADLADDLTTYPQVLLNVRVREKADLENDSRSRHRHETGRRRAWRQRPAARPLLRNGTAPPRDARGAGSAADRPVGPSDCRCRQ